jgi:hypothetical protein
MKKSISFGLHFRVLLELLLQSAPAGNTFVKKRQWFRRLTVVEHLTFRPVSWLVGIGHDAQIKSN